MANIIVNEVENFPLRMDKMVSNGENSVFYLEKARWIRKNIKC